MSKGRARSAREPLTTRLAAALASEARTGSGIHEVGDVVFAAVVRAIAAERGLADAPALRGGPGAVLGCTARMEAPWLELDELVALSRAEGADAALGLVHEAELDAADLVEGGGGRRRGRGAHFTPRSLSARVVGRALELLGPERVSRAWVCDPACGAGAFLCEVLRQAGGSAPSSRVEVASRLRGIDRDPRAARAARWALWLEVGDASRSVDAVGHVVEADALLDASSRAAPRRVAPWGERLGASGGFDLVVGNPPFLGGKRLRTVHGDAYADALVRAHPGTTKNVDLAAHFLLRGYDELAEGGVLALVVTNTIAQGATRRGGLAQLVERGASVESAERRVPWPGAAGVIVSTLHVRRGPARARPMLDGAPVDAIDAYLSASGRSAPPRIGAQRGVAFIGCFLRGAGFVVDDADPRAIPSAELEVALRRDPRSAEVVRPFLGGEEVVRDPWHRPHRRVIAFGSSTEGEARAYPGAFELVERHVRPAREALGASASDRQHKAVWWRFANPRPELARAARGLSRVIVVPRLSAHLVAVRIPNEAVFSDQLVVFASDSAALLALLSSRVHAVWAHANASTLGDGLRYVPTDAFETFPFPRGSLAAALRDRGLEGAGERFERARRAALDEARTGLTALLGRVHDPSERGASIVALREAWAEVDRAVAAAYGWRASDVEVDFADDARGRTRLGFDADVTRAVLARLDALAREAG